MDGGTNESPPVFYRTLSPLGPLPCFLSLQFIIMQSRAKGIADHILPLGDLFPVSVLPPKIRPSDPKSSLFDPKSGLSDQNRSPKGNMWSAIPVALLRVIMNWSEGKQGSGPKGDEVL